MTSVLIISANRGLGLEFVAQYVAQGWHVYAACRHPDSAEQLQRLAQTAKGQIDILSMDVTNALSIAQAAAAIPNSAIDLLVNSAGITVQRSQIVGTIDYAAWAQVLDVNTMGPFRVLETFLKHIARSERKLVVTITTGMGSLADNTSGGSIAYRSSKAAVNMAMRSAAIDLAPRGISCVLVNPGWVRTDMGGSGPSVFGKTESVTALRRLIETFGPAQSGKFFHYDGQ